VDAAEFLSKNMDIIVKGCYWADSLWKNATHHYNPKTKRGLWIWPGAQDQCKNWFSYSMKALAAGNVSRALFFLGASVHTVQDACQPYHSNCVCLDGHQKYENWVDRHKEDFAVGENGVYDLASKPEGWVIENACFSQELLPKVKINGNSTDGCADLSEATRLCLGRAQRTTAGFFVFFLKEAGKLGNVELLGLPTGNPSK